MIGWSERSSSRARAAPLGLRAPEYRESRPAAIATFRATGVGAPYEKEYRRKDGTGVPVLFGGALLDDDSYVAFAIDLREKRRSEAALRESQRRFDALWRSGVVGVVDRGRPRGDHGGQRCLPRDRRLLARGSRGRPDRLRRADPARAARSDRQGGGADRSARLRRAVGDGDDPQGRQPAPDHGRRRRDRRASRTSRSSPTSRRASARRTCCGGPRSSSVSRRRWKRSVSLAGGVAHDFNNLLSVILSYSETAARRPRSPTTRCAATSSEIVQGRDASAPRRSPGSSSSFSRQQVLSPTVLDLNAVLLGVEKMLRRLDRRGHRARRRPGVPGSGACAPTPRQHRAGDHEPRGQRARRHARRRQRSRSRPPTSSSTSDYAATHLAGEAGPSRHAGGERHRHAAWTARRRRASSSRSSRPRRSARAPGSASSTVFGIVQQSGGHIWVYSEPGRGHDVQGLPPARRRRGRPASRPPIGARARCAAPRRSCWSRTRSRCAGSPADILRRNGYTVLEAAEPRRGAAAVRGSTPRPIDLLLTDVVMPQMSGPELAERLRAGPARPERAVHVGLHRRQRRPPRRRSTASDRRSCRSRSRPTRSRARCARSSTSVPERESDDGTVRRPPLRPPRR